MPEAEERPAEDRETASRANRTLNRDGLVDVALGVGLLSAGLYVWSGPAWRIRLSLLAALVPLLTVLVVGVIRRRLVYPRIGSARLPALGALPGLSVILTGLFLIGLMAFLVYPRSGWETPGGLVWLLRGLMLAAATVLVLMGARSGLTRFYAHAGVIAASVLLAGLLFGATRMALLLMVTVPGAVLVSTGVLLFRRFLRTYVPAKHPVLG